jgi:hypothetical protein
VCKFLYESILVLALFFNKALSVCMGKHLVKYKTTEPDQKPIIATTVSLLETMDSSVVSTTVTVLLGESSLLIYRRTVLL